jgi:hypothetical protein
LTTACQKNKEEKKLSEGRSKEERSEKRKKGEEKNLHSENH